MLMSMFSQHLLDRVKNTHWPSLLAGDAALVHVNITLAQREEKTCWCLLVSMYSFFIISSSSTSASSNASHWTFRSSSPASLKVAHGSGDNHVTSSSLVGIEERTEVEGAGPTAAALKQQGNLVRIPLKPVHKPSSSRSTSVCLQGHVSRCVYR